MIKREVVIIGAGPAGISCAIQLKRYGFEPLLLEGNSVGGLVLNANMVENYPGFPKGISGSELACLFEKQLRRFGVEVLIMKAEKLDFSEKNFIIRTDKKTINAKTVVVASGTVPRKLRIDTGLKSNCIFYDVLKLKSIENKDICIIGGGDAALDYALTLSRNNEVLVLCRKKNVSCVLALLEKVKGQSNIRISTGCEVKNLFKQGDKLVLHCSCANDISILTDIVVAAIGRIANVGFLSQDLKSAYEIGKRTKNIYFIGDVVEGEYRQVGIAVGDGIRIAMEIFKGRAKMSGGLAVTGKVR